MNQEHQKLLDILYQALSEPIGIIVASSNPESDKMAFYAVKAKAQAQDPALEGLQIRLSPWSQEGQIIICNRRVTMPSQQSPSQESL